MLGFWRKGDLFEDNSFSIDEILDLEIFSDDHYEEEATENISVTPLETYEAIDSNSPTLLLPGFSLPTHDAADLEWVSNIIDDSLSDFPPTSKPVDMTNMESQMVCTLYTEAQVPPRSKRTKRSHTPTSSSSSTNSEESCLLYEPQNPEGPPEKQKAQKRGRKAGQGSAPAAKERRCSHCGVNKTPQWRKGPEGAKTLCNACGVRYKSGRLLPEYRPACSPTFEVALHSNSHRKVLEMRKKREAELGEVAAAF